MTGAASTVVRREAFETELLAPIRDVSHAVLRLLVPHIVAAGMEKSTFWPLHYLDGGGQLHPGALARRLGVTPATCTASVDQLVELGYVARRPSVQDRRQIELRVTPKGHRALEGVWRNFDGALKEVLVGLPPADVTVTARTLATIAARLRTEPILAEERA
jgi:DNA-binding MarR family transcriptional regulator